MEGGGKVVGEEVGEQGLILLAEEGSSFSQPLVLLHDAPVLQVELQVCHLHLRARSSLIAISFLTSGPPLRPRFGLLGEPSA